MDEALNVLSSLSSSHRTFDVLDTNTPEDAGSKCFARLDLLGTQMIALSYLEIKTDQRQNGSRRQLHFLREGGTATKEKALTGGGNHTGLGLPYDPPLAVRPSSVFPASPGLTFHGEMGVKIPLRTVCDN